MFTSKRLARIWAGAVVALLAVLCLSAPAARAQCTLGSPSTWIDANGNWSSAGNWSPSGAPNSSSTNVCITDTTSAVTLDMSASVADLQLASGNTLTFNPGEQLYVYGPDLINAGQITVNGGGGFNTYFYVPSNVTLTGGGTVTLTTTAASGGYAYLYPYNGSTLDNVDNTIQGEGIIYNNGTTIINESGGTINANSTGSPLIGGLYLDYGAVTNKGLMEATGSGTFWLYDTTVNNAGGNITANGSGASVEIYGGTDILGGTLNNNGGAFFGTPVNQVAYLNGSTGAGAVTINGTYTSDFGSATYLYGSIVNNGNILVNGGNGSTTYLYVPTSVTLTGGGTVTLSTTAASGGNGYLYLYNGGTTLDNVNNTIQGEGIIYNDGTTIVNESGGTINANSTGSPLSGGLYLEYGTVTNTGLMEATGSGTLWLYGTTVNNAGGNITANGSGASVEIYGGTDIVGGTLNNKGGAFFGTPAGQTAYLDGSEAAGAVTINGTYTSDVASNTLLYGLIVNNGNILVNGGGGQTTDLSVPTSVTLTGGGTVTLSTTAASGGNAELQLYNGGTTLTNVNNTIQGEGIIYNNGTTIVNEATINANSTGSPLSGGLYLEYGTVNNTGLMEATGSGTLWLYGTTVNNAGGNITANGSGASVEIYGGTDIVGGTLNNNGGAFFGTYAGNTASLDGSTAAGAVTINGTYTADYSSNTYLYGSIVNNGNLLVNGGNGSTTYLYLPTSVTLTGGGTVTLSTTAASGGYAYLELYNGGTTLTNTNNTIQGEGVIYNNGTTIVNEATINANSSGSPLINTLYLEYGTVNNTGLLEATNNGTLELYDVTVNNAGGNITANGSGASVTLVAGTDIVGGTLNNNGGAFFGTLAGSTATLDGSTGAGAVTINGTYTSDYGSATYLYGTINNKGNILVNGGGGSTTYVYVPTSVTLTGGGTVTLATTAASGGYAYLELYNGGTTLTNTNNTIQGEGIISNNGTTIINEAGGTILANSTGSPLTSTLYIDYGTVTNNGTLQANSGNTLWLYDGTFTNFSGNTLTGGTYNVYGAGPTSPGTLQIDALGSTGGEIQNNAATILLSGPNSNFVDQAGLDALSNFQSNTAAGSFTIQNGRNLTTPGAFSNAGTMTVGTAVGDSSTFMLGSSGTNSYNQSAGMTQGTGTIAGAVTINGGAIQPGLTNTAGTLAITGTFNLSSGTFNEQIAGGGGNNGLLNISGASTLGLGANLAINLLGGFTPTTGEQFTIMDFASGSGTFANAPSGPNGFALGGEVWTIAYNPTDVILNAILPVDTNVTATWNTPSGNWTAATEWSCTPGPANCVPNNGTPVTITYGANIDSAGNTLTLSTPASITINTLTLTAGTLDIGAGATLNLVSQSSGITDIPSGTGLDVAGTFEVNGGPTSALAQLGSVEGTLTLEGQTLAATPGGGTFTNSGTVNLQQTTAFTISGNLTNSGTINTGNGASDTGSNSLTVTGTLRNMSGGLIALNAAGDSLAADLTNSGTIELNNSTQTLTDTGDFNNSGGTLSFTGSTDIANVSGNFNNTNGGTVSLTGSKGQINVTSGTFTNDSTSTVTMAGTGDTITTGAFSNAGSVTIGANETIKATGAGGYSQSGGTTTLQGLGALNASTGGVSITGGTLQGLGTITGNVSMGGTIIAGVPGTPGTLTINGAYTQTAAGVYNELISSTANGLLNVSGNTTLVSGASLDITLLAGFNPAPGTTYTILDYGGTEGGGFTITDPTFNGGTEMWGISYGTGSNSDVVLTAESVTVTVPPTTVTATWTTGATGNGHWTTATEWSCSSGPSTCVPNNGTPANTNYAAVLDFAGNTLTLDGTDSPASITINTLTLEAGTLDIGTGGTLNLVSQPGGITDIPSGAGLDVAGTFEVNGGPTSALAELASVEGTLTLEGQTLTATPGGGTFTNSGTVNLQQTTAFTISGNLTNSGTINTGNGASDTGSNSLTVTGTLRNMSGGLIALNAAGDSLTADLTNSGTIELNNNNQTLTDTGDFNNSGGTLSFTGSTDIANVAGNFNNTNGGTVSLTGSKGQINVTSGTFTNDGTSTVTMAGANDVITAGTFNNAGSVTIGASETITTGAGGYTQTGGTTQGFGTINGNVAIKGGNLIVGTQANPGIFTITGNAQLSGALTTYLEGTTAGAGGYSQLVIGGTASLGGTLDVDYGNGFTPAVGNDFYLLASAGGDSGQFSTLDIQALPTGEAWVLNYYPGSCPDGDSGCLELEVESSTSPTPPPVTVTPEPSTMVLVATGLFGLLAQRRMKRRSRKARG